MAAFAARSRRLPRWSLLLLSATTAVIGAATKNDGELLIEFARGYIGLDEFSVTEGIL